MPWVVKIFVNLMWPFVDPNTKKKVKFDVDVVQEGDVEPEMLLKECGGNVNVSVPLRYEVKCSSCLAAVRPRHLLAGDDAGVPRPKSRPARKVEIVRRATSRARREVIQDVDFRRTECASGHYQYSE